MLFNSLPFALFLPAVFAIYWILGRSHYRAQNVFMIGASYLFYGWWDWRFLFLIFISSLADYVIGILMHGEKAPGKRKFLLVMSLCVNLGILGFFKYFNFFVDSFAEILAAVGMQPNFTTLRIILPVGISFYTFQTLSYTLDIYRRQIEPTRDPISFFAFVSFFPQLVAGPIERARDLLPQFLKPRVFDQAKAHDGLRQMLWGFFKKIVIADAMAPQVEEIYRNYAQYDGIVIAIGTFFFAIPDIPTSPSDPPDCSGSTCGATSPSPIFPGTSPNSGAGGTSPCPPGSVITSSFPWAATGAAGTARSSTFLSHSPSAGCGTVPTGPS